MAFDWTAVEQAAVQYGPTVVELLADGLKYLMSLPEADRQKAINDLRQKQAQLAIDRQGLQDEVARVEAMRDQVIAELKAKQSQELKSLADKHVAEWAALTPKPA